MKEGHQLNVGVCIDCRQAVTRPAGQAWLVRCESCMSQEEKMDEYLIPYGTPAVDVLDVPPHSDSLPMKKVVLVCPACGDAGIWIENPDTTLVFGDPATECDECGYGQDYLGLGDGEYEEK